MRKYYVYIHAYPKNYPDKYLAGMVFYIGKGTGDRIDDHEREARQGKKSHKCSIIRKIWREGYEVDKQKIGFFDDENEAYQFEQVLILFFGKENLANLCDGGEGGARPGAGRYRQVFHLSKEVARQLFFIVQHRQIQQADITSKEVIEEIIHMAMRKAEAM